MEKVILYVDDASYASEFLARLSAEPAGAKARHWVLVACAPRMTHRISKWVSHSARESWRAKWFARLQDQLHTALLREGSEVTPILAAGPLAELTRRLRLEVGAVEVIDARRPKIGVDLEPVAPDQTPSRQTNWSLPGLLMGLGALLVLANELSE